MAATALCQPITRAGNPAAPSAEAGAPQPAPSGSRPGPGSSDAAGDCAQCHRMDPLFSHPVDIHPSMAVPDDLPLSAGRITCTTCHAATQPGHGRRGAGEAALQGGRTAAELCQACHSTGLLDRASAHALGMLRAHNGTEGGVEGQNRRLSAVFGDFDRVTADCLTCHDGSVIEGSSHLAAAAMMDLGISHPVGVEYRQDRGGHLRPKHALDDRVRLFSDRVSCGSCHSVYSPQPALLVMSNEGSALCLSCHRQ